MLLRFDPFHDRVVETAPARRGGGLMAMDAYRDGDEVVVHFDVPGVAEEDVDVTVERDTVTVNVERRWEQRDRPVLVQERSQGAYSRVVLLGDTLDGTKLAAELADGVLTLRVPVREQAQPRRIDVTSSGSSSSIEQS